MKRALLSLALVACSANNSSVADDDIVIDQAPVPPDPSYFQLTLKHDKGVYPGTKRLSECQGVAIATPDNGYQQQIDPFLSADDRGGVPKTLQFWVDDKLANGNRITRTRFVSDPDFLKDLAEQNRADAITAPKGDLVGDYKLRVTQNSNAFYIFTMPGHPAARIEPLPGSPTVLNLYRIEVGDTVKDPTSGRTAKVTSYTVSRVEGDEVSGLTCSDDYYKRPTDLEPKTGVDVLPGEYRVEVTYELNSGDARKTTETVRVGPR